MISFLQVPRVVPASMVTHGYGVVDYRPVTPTHPFRYGGPQDREGTHVRRPALRTLAPVAAVVGVFAFHAWGTLTWLSRHALPDGWQNEFLHVFRAVEVFFRIRDMGGEGIHFWLFEEYYPPLQALLGVAALGVGPNRVDTLAASNLVWLGLLVGATYGLGRRLTGPWSAALAAALVSFYPSIYGNLRHFEPNVALAALAVAAIWALDASDGFRRTVPSIAFGLAVSAGLLVDRISMAPLVAIPALTVAVHGLRSIGVRRDVWFRIGLVAAIVVALCGYYYWHFAQTHLAEITSQVDGEIDSWGARTEHRSPLSPFFWLYYPLSWIDCQMGLALALAALAALATSLAQPRRPGWVVLVWVVGGLALFTLLGKKQPYYTLPLLPGLAVLTARELGRIRPRGLAAAAAVVLLLLGLHQWAALSFNRPLLPSGGPLAYLSFRSPVPDNWLGRHYQQVRPPFDPGLHFDEAIAAVWDDGFDPSSHRVVVCADGTEFYESYLVTMSRLRLDTMALEGVMVFPQAVAEGASRTDYFIYYTRDPDSAWPTEVEIRRTYEEFYEWHGSVELLEAMEDMGRRAVQLARYPVHSGGAVRVFRVEAAT